MIDSKQLALTFHGETRRHQDHWTFQEQPELTADQKWTRQVEDQPLPAPEHLAQVIEECFWATTLKDEGRPCRPRLRYLPKPAPHRIVHWFSTPVPLDRQALRKLAPTQGPLHSCLVWAVVDGGPVITGIDVQPGGDPGDLRIDGTDFGAISISWNFFKYLTFRGGEARWLLQCALPDSGVLSPLLASVLGDITGSFLLARMDSLAKDGHGGAFWIVRDPERLSGVTIGTRLRDEPTILERFEQQVPWLDSITALAGADGAVLMDAKGRVLGFGAFTDIPAEFPMLQRLPGGETESITSFQLGGGRHRSAAQFCQSCAPAAAVVVSADGRVMVLVGALGDPLVWCAEVNTVGFHMP